MRTKRVPRHEEGILAIPLGPNGAKGEAYLLPEDFELLVKLGLSTQWNLNPLGYVTAPCARAPGANVSVARVLLDCGPGQRVSYLDGNKLNLRRENLKLKGGAYSFNRPRAFLGQ
jgi:hypothetical protein